MRISELEPIMNSCSNLYFLSTIACRLSDCLSEKELAVLSADLVVLSDMIANMLARDELCKKQKSSDLLLRCILQISFVNEAAIWSRE